MQEYEERVLEELTELRGKCAKLYTFIHSRNCVMMESDTARELLHMQYHAMKVYAGILEQRIKLF